MDSVISREALKKIKDVLTSVNEKKLISDISATQQQEPKRNRKERFTELLLPLIGRQNVESLLSKIDINDTDSFDFNDFANFFISSVHADEWMYDFYRMKILPLHGNSKLQSSSISEDNKHFHTNQWIQSVVGGEDGQLKAWRYQRSRTVSMSPLTLSHSCDHMKTNDGLSSSAFVSRNEKNKEQRFSSGGTTPNKQQPTIHAGRRSSNDSGIGSGSDDVNQHEYKNPLHHLHRRRNGRAVAVTAICTLPWSAHICVGSVDSSVTVYEISAAQGFEVCARLHNEKFLSSPPNTLQSFQNIRSSDPPPLTAPHAPSPDQMKNKAAASDVVDRTAQIESVTTREAVSPATSTTSVQQHTTYQSALYIAIGDGEGYICIYKIDPRFGRKESKGGQFAETTRLRRETDHRESNKTILALAFSESPYFRSRIHNGGITQSKFIPALGLLLSSSYDGTLSFFDVSKREVLRRFDSRVHTLTATNTKKSKSSPIICFTWWTQSRGHKNIISGSGRILHVWNPFTFIPASLDSDRSLSAPVVDVVVNHKDRLVIAYCNDGKMNVFRSDSFTRVQFVSLFSYLSLSPRLSSDYTATSSEDNAFSRGARGDVDHNTKPSRARNDSNRARSAASFKMANNILLVCLGQGLDSESMQMEESTGSPPSRQQDEEYSSSSSHCVLFTSWGVAGTRIYPWIFGWNQHQNEHAGVSIEPNAYSGSFGSNVADSLDDITVSIPRRGGVITEDNSRAADVAAGGVSVSDNEIVGVLFNAVLMQTICVFLNGTVDVFDCKNGRIIRRFHVGSTTSQQPTTTLTLCDPNKMGIKVPSSFSITPEDSRSLFPAKRISVRSAGLDSAQRRLLVALYRGTIEVWNFNEGVLLQAFEPSLRSVFVVPDTTSLIEMLQGASAFKLKQRTSEISLLRETVTYIGFVSFPSSSSYTGKRYIAVGYESGLSCFFEAVKENDPSGNRGDNQTVSFMPAAAFSMTRDGNKVILILGPHQVDDSGYRDMRIQALNHDLQSKSSTNFDDRILISYAHGDCIYWTIPDNFCRASTDTFHEIDEVGNGAAAQMKGTNNIIADDATIYGVHLLCSSHCHGVKRFGMGHNGVLSATSGGDGSGGAILPTSILHHSDIITHPPSLKNDDYHRARDVTAIIVNDVDIKSEANKTVAKQAHHRRNSASVSKPKVVRLAGKIQQQLDEEEQQQLQQEECEAGASQEEIMLSRRRMLAKMMNAARTAKVNPANDTSGDDSGMSIIHSMLNTRKSDANKMTPFSSSSDGGITAVGFLSTCVPPGTPKPSFTATRAGGRERAGLLRYRPYGNDVPTSAINETEITGTATSVSAAISTAAGTKELLNAATTGANGHPLPTPVTSPSPARATATTADSEDSDNMRPKSLVTCVVSLSDPSYQDHESTSIMLGACSDGYFRVWARHSAHSVGGELLCSYCYQHQMMSSPVGDDDRYDGVITTLAVNKTREFLIGGFDNGDVAIWSVDYHSLKTLVALQRKHSVLFARHCGSLSSLLLSAAKMTTDGGKKDIPTLSNPNSNPSSATHYNNTSQIVRSGLNDAHAVKSAAVKTTEKFLEIASLYQHHTGTEVDAALLSSVAQTAARVRGEEFTEVSSVPKSALKMSGAGSSGSVSGITGPGSGMRRGGLLGEASSGSQRVSIEQPSHPDIPHSGLTARSTFITPPSTATTIRSRTNRVRWSVVLESGRREDMETIEKLRKSKEGISRVSMWKTIEEQNSIIALKKSDTEDRNAVQEATAFLMSPFALLNKWTAHRAQVLSVGLLDSYWHGETGTADEQHTDQDDTSSATQDNNSRGASTNQPSHQRHKLHVLSSGADQSVALWTLKGELVGNFGCQLWHENDINDVVEAVATMSGGVSDGGTVSAAKRYPGGSSYSEATVAAATTTTSFRIPSTIHSPSVPSVVPVAVLADTSLLKKENLQDELYDANKTTRGLSGHTRSARIEELNEYTMALKDLVWNKQPIVYKQHSKFLATMVNNRLNTT